VAAPAGCPSARGYHNREWAAKMKTVGLQPSNTGALGGKETGAADDALHVTGGPYQVAYSKLAAGWKLNLQSASGHAANDHCPSAGPAVGGSALPNWPSWELLRQ
jgi:hypothetical protein